ncbi:hypothetical protein LZD49_12465 [Dyadobacter sp. CY261]|uniref:hypothetical protein n=1 Tax=Dyadobacter sp. CY261 TaxID=2907203 RepID=UPI001F3981D9|nr:hypothetical protein [Dyadobacter sp. CY261]MCF0071286.1 hypothetical protein [Dyadobacter sp. CY261]
MSLPEKVPARPDVFEDDFDDIFKWYTDPEKFKISETQQRQLARWRFAREWYTNFDPFNDIQVVRALMKEYGISERQAYLDVKASQRFFCTVDQANEEFEKVMLIERTKRLRKKAIESGTAKGLLIASKCDATLLKIFGFDREKALMPTPVIANITINTDPATVGALPIANFEALKKTFWKKKEEKAMADAQDIDHDEIFDKPRNERDHQRK